jgi:uncharacterized protein
MTSTMAQLKCLRSSFLNLILMPTEACNFRCTYCYETFEHKKMPASVVTGVKSLIDRRAGDLDKLLISWFGGEPLLAFDIITDISRHAMSVARSNGFDFSADMTTNGYLLDRTRFSSCLENGIRTFQISLDGDEQVHNASRQLASGAGTFDRLWANIMGMKEVPGDFTILLRLHYTFENFPAIGKFSRRLNQVLGDDPRFQFFFRNITRLGGLNDESITPLSDMQRRDIEAQLWRASGLPQAPEEEDATAADDICYAAKGNSLLVRSTGRLGKCTVALNNDFNDIGFIRENGEICVDQEKFRRWVAPVIDGDWEVAKCPLNWVGLEAELDAARAQAPSAPAPAQA